jgi:hypothetical protein
LLALSLAAAVQALQAALAGLAAQPAAAHGGNTGIEATVTLLLLGRGRVLISHRMLGRGLALVGTVGTVGLGLGRGLGRVGPRCVVLGKVALGRIATVGEEEEAVSQSVPSRFVLFSFHRATKQAKVRGRNGVRHAMPGEARLTLDSAT